MRLALVYLIGMAAVLWRMPSSRAQDSKSVVDRHAELVSMARDMVQDRPELFCRALKPKFHICGEGHLHWLRGWPGIDVGAFPMDARLDLEWFWKHLTPTQRVYWKPHLRRVDELVLQYMRIAEKRPVTAEEEGAIRNEVNTVYENAAKEYAKTHGVALKAESFSICCGVEYAEIVLRPNVKGVSAIHWATAGDVWYTLSTTGAEPEYKNYAPGAKVPVTPGGLYYYRLVMRNGRQSRRLLAPAITGSAAVVLVWR